MERGDGKAPPEKGWLGRDREEPFLAPRFWLCHSEGGDGAVSAPGTGKGQGAPPGQRGFCGAQVPLEFLPLCLVEVKTVLEQKNGINSELRVSSLVGGHGQFQLETTESSPQSRGDGISPEVCFPDK